MELVYLADNKQAIPVIANWYFEQWGFLRQDDSLQKVTARLEEYLNRDKIPLMVLAMEDGEILGASQLKYREMDIYPEKEHWLGGVYVAETHRGNGIATALVKKIITLAEQFGVEKLYLQTEHPDGGLYRRLGWQGIERVNNHGMEVLVMEKAIGK